MRCRYPLATLALLVLPGPTALSAQEYPCGTELTTEDVRRLEEQAWVYDVPQPRAGGTLWIPVTFHVVRQSDGTGGLTAADVCTAVQTLNAAYVDFFEGPIRFYRPGWIRYIDSDYFYASVLTIQDIDALRTTDVVPGTLNIYCTDRVATAHGELCGISSFTTSPVQGIVMRNSCMPPGNESTLPHEVGHYLDLFHTHSTVMGAELVDGSNCSTAGDLLCDTPADPTLGSSSVVPPLCIYNGTAVDANGDAYVPDARNYMSYAPQVCRIRFSPGQRARARSTLTFLRPEIVQLVSQAPDCNLNLLHDECEIVAYGLEQDCNRNQTPDSCEEEPCEVVEYGVGLNPALLFLSTENDLAYIGSDLEGAIGPTPSDTATARVFVSRAADQVAAFGGTVLIATDQIVNSFEPLLPIWISGYAALSMTIPPNASLIGNIVYMQGVIIDPGGAEPYRLSNGVEVRIGAP